MKDFQNFGTSWACLSIPDHAPKHDLIICSFKEYAPARKKNIYIYIYTSYSLSDTKDLKILQPDWSRAFLHTTWEPHFSQTCDFCRTIKADMVPPLQQKNLHITTQNPKNPILGVFLSIIPKMRFFPKNLTLSIFYLSVTLTSWGISEKSYEPFWRKSVYLLTYWHTYWQWWFHRIPFHLKAEVQKSTLEFQQFLRYVSFTSLFGHVWPCPSKITYLKLHDYTPLVSEILKFWKSLWACLGMPDHTHLNLHNQFIILKPQRQIWDILQGVSSLEV